MKMGHEVQYFGMEHEGRCVGNRVNAYTSDMDFHGGSKLNKLSYPIKTIYSKEARIQIRKVLDDFKPDVCHLNNFNYQLTPSIILEIVKWRKKSRRNVMTDLNRRIGDKPFIVEVGEIESVDIDEAEDFMIADAIYNYKLQQK